MAGIEGDVANAADSVVSSNGVHTCVFVVSNTARCVAILEVCQKIMLASEKRSKVTAASA